MNAKTKRTKRNLFNKLAKGMALTLLATVGQTAAGGTESQKAPDGLAIHGYDPVAYFTMVKAVKGLDSIDHVWLDRRWAFANEEHKALFVANPTRYMPNYGGYCAYDPVSEGHNHTVDPTAWRIVNNKLYLFYSETKAAYAMPIEKWDKVKAGLAQ